MESEGGCMKKLVLSISIILTLLIPASPVHANDVDLKSENVIVISLNHHKILYEKNSSDKIYPASMTKIMTAIVAIEHIDDLNKTHVITEKDLEGLVEANASVAGFQLNQTVTYKDLLYGILLPSGADATQAIANELFGSQKAFVKEMNKKAKVLHLDNTHFVNTSGLHNDNHYSTVSDIAKLLEYALENETFKEIFCSDSYTVTDQSFTMYSTRLKTSWMHPMNTDFILGSKTGFTYEAGLCLASYNELYNEKYIMISAQTNSKNEVPYHFEDAVNMNKYLNNKFEPVTLHNQNDKIPVKVNIRYSNIETIDLRTSKEISYLKDKTRKNKITYKFKLNDDKEYLDAPIKKNTEIGTLKVYCDSQLIHQDKVLLDKTIEKHTLTYYFNHPFIFIKEILLLPVSVIIIVFSIKLYNSKKTRGEKSC